MKKEFTKDEFIESYPYLFKKEVKIKVDKLCNELLKSNFIGKLLQKSKNTIKYTDVLNLNDISLLEKLEWIYECLELTQKEQQELALKLCIIIEPIYSKHFSKEDKIKDCNNARKLFIDNKMNDSRFLIYRNRALDAAEYTYNGGWYYTLIYKYDNQALKYVAEAAASEPNRAYICAYYAAFYNDEIEKTNYINKLLKVTKKYLATIK
jgi:hypothetical protein